VAPKGRGRSWGACCRRSYREVGEMREFVLPFKPEELLAQPADGRLWAQDLPAVDEWSADDIGAALDSLIGRLMSSHGCDLAEDESFSLIFALLQAWPRMDESLYPRIVDLLADAARRLVGEAARLKKTHAKQKEQNKLSSEAQEAKTASKVAVFFLRWAAERVLKKASTEGATRRGGKGSRKGGDQEAAAEEAKEAQKAIERQRVSVLGEIANLVGKGAMPWLWSSDPNAWQQAASAVSDAGFLVLDNEGCLKHREIRQTALRCIAEPLLQEGQQHSNLLVATVSKLMHGLRGPEGSAPFAADALLLAHATPLPRLFLVEITQHCSPAELSSQGAFQRALAAFLVAASERLPHIVLANISVLLPLLDVDCYPLRSAIVETIGQLLSAEGKKLPHGARCSSGNSDAAKEEGGEQAVEEGTSQGQSSGGPVVYFTVAHATKKDLLETLMARSLDKSVWVRFRALQTLTNLASNSRHAALPRDQWARVLEIAIKRMQDTASYSRKAAMQLVRALIEFHPYGPALQGPGDERAKAEKLLKEVADRFQKLNAEEAAEAEAELAANGGGVKAEEAEEEEDEEAAEGEDGAAEVEEEKAPEAKPVARRLKKKTMTEQTITTEVERDLAAEGEQLSERRAERERQRTALKRMHDCYSQRVHFVELIDAAEARLRALLVSRTSTDVTEAISVVVELRLRGVPAAARAFDQVLGLVWSRQGNVKDAAVDAFHRMQLEGRDTTRAASTLLDMYTEGCKGGGSWTYTHLASVQELFQQATEKELIDPAAAIPAFVTALQGSACPMALRALTALGGANAAELVKTLPRISQLVGAGGASCGSTPGEQLERARLVCQLIQRLQQCAKVNFPDEVQKHFWALSDHVTHVVIENFARGTVPAEWFGAAQAAMDLSFDLSMTSTTAKDTPARRCPDKLWEQILSRMLQSLLAQREGTSPPAAEEAVVESEAADEAMSDSVVPAPEVHSVPTPQLGCVVFLAGHLALRMVIYLEGLQSSLKRKRLADEDARMAEQREKKKAQKAEQKAKKGKGGKAAAAEEEEEGGAEASSMGMAGQEEREADAFAEISELGLLFSKRSLLDRVKPLILSCLCNSALRQDPVVRRLGAISLCKYMTVSKRFCEEYLQLIFSILFPKEKEVASTLCGSAEEAEGAAHDAAAGTGSLLEDLTLRQSLLVAVGDLLFRHPNVVEPWTGRLYATLSATGQASDSAAEMRLTALLVLTHLVLNDMMKPRAVLLVRALWLTACTHDATARVARILFQELSKRSTNVVYNLLPEIIARLPEHQGSAGTVEGGSEGRVQYIMQFIEKEKHVDGLIEKLSVRLEQTANVAGDAGKVLASTQASQAVDEAADVPMDGDVAGDSAPSQAGEAVKCLAHALGSMTYSDRCILHLHDIVVNRKGLNTALSYHAVARECLISVVEKTRRPKPGKAGGAAEAPAEAEAPAAGGEAVASKGGASAAAAAALDAIEQTVMGLGAGQVEAAADGPAATPIADGAPAVGGGRGGKRKAEAAKKEAKAEGDNPGFDDGEGEKKAGGKARRRGKGRGRGGAGGRGRGGAEEKEEPVEGGKAASARPPAQPGKKRRAVKADDDEE